MKPEIRKRLARLGALCVFAFVMGSMMGLFEAKDEVATVVTKESTSTPMPGASQIGGPYELVNQDGAIVTDKDFSGDYKLIYFGFTYCPAICPTELQKISKVMKTLDEDMAAKIQPLFITIDPERDTADVMREYVGLFHPKLIGLTGSREQMNAALKSYRVFASKVQDPDSDDPDDYTMDHSSYIYLMSPDDQLISMYRIQDDAAYMIRDISQKL